MNQLNKLGTIKTFLFLGAFLVLGISSAQVNFTQSQLGLNGQGTLTGVTSLMYGPDGRLYVAEYPTGNIKVLSIVRNAADDYVVTKMEVLTGISDIVNHDDDGNPCSGTISNCTQREVTGLTVAGTSANPVIYVTSSDVRIGAGNEGGNGDVNLDTNSGIITRFTWTGTQWEVVDLIRGLSRSEENHGPNGLERVSINGTEYLIIAAGGNTNGGAPSKNFVYTCEYALSGAILAVNLDMLNGMPVQQDGNGRNYIYDLPTMDDPTRPNANGITDPDDPAYNGIDINDPWGGNDGLNQAVLEDSGPVSIFAPGFRNAYDLVITTDGMVYATDNGANQGWGGIPDNEGGGTVTNNYNPAEPGSSAPAADGELVNNLDHLEFITSNIQTYSFGSYYAGHPNPIRANPVGAGLYTAPETTTTNNAVFRTQTYDPDGSTPGSTTNPAIALPANWASLVPGSNPVEGDYRAPGLPNPEGAADNPLLIWGTNTNGIDEYTASNFAGSLQGDLIAGVNTGELRRVERNPDGTLQNLTPSFASGLGGNALGITCNGDQEVFPGTIWAGTLNGLVIVLEPAENVICYSPGDPEYEATADYDSDGYTNEDELDNGTDPCNGASQPNDFDKNSGGILISDLNDPDDDNDGIPDATDPFQLGDPLSGGSDAFSLPVQNGFFNGQQGLGGFLGLGITGLMNNGDPNPNWLNWLDDKGEGPNPDDVLGGAAGLITSHMTSGTAIGSLNTQEKGYQYGVQVDQNTGVFTVSGNLINFSGPSQLYGNTAAVGGELGLFIGDGSQSNFIKFVISQDGITALQEINDVPQPPLYQPIPTNSRPQSDIVFYFLINPLNGVVNLEYAIDGGTRNFLGIINAQGAVLTALQQSNQDLAVGIIGSSNTPGVELEGTWDFLHVVAGGSTTNTIRINAGGSLVLNSDGKSDWQDDSQQGPHTGDGYSVNTGLIFPGTLLYANRHSSIPPYIDEQTFDAIFAQERWDIGDSPEMTYTIPVLNGNYVVNLYMGNSFSGTSQIGQRIFDVLIEGILVRNDLDLISEFGHQSGGMLSFSTTVTDGELNIGFGHVVENPLINAIEVLSSSPSENPILVDPIADQINVEGEVLNGSLVVVASGGDGDLSYVMSGQPAGISIDPTTGLISGTINSGTATNSPYNVMITVDDSDGDSNDAVTINFTWNVTVPGSCTWTDLADASTARMESRAEIIDTKIYSMGGFMPNLIASDVNEIYHPETNTWSLGAPMPFASTHQGSVAVGDEIWLIGGFTGDHPGPATDIVVIYNSKTNSWSNGPNLPQPIGGGAATYHNNKIHFFGGLLPDRQTDIGDHYVLDLSNQAAGWTTAAPMPIPRNHHWAETLNGILYSIGGQTGHDGPIVYLDAVHAYNPVTDSWTQVASLPRTRSHTESSTSVHDNKILLTGGRDGGFYFDDVLEYDPVGDNWTLLCNTPDPLLAPVGLAYNNQFILSGGETGNTNVFTVETRSLALQPGTAFTPLQINPIADRTDNTNDAINFTVSGSGGDPFADLSYFLEGQPQGIDINTRTGQVSGTIDALAHTGGPNNDGIFPVEVRMSKPGSVGVKFNFTWTVENTGRWSVKGEDPNYLGRHECGFVQAGDKFYLMGGRESSSVEMYDYQNDSWTNLGDAPVNLNHFQGVEFQGLIWVIGALQGDNFPADVPADHIWIYSPVNNEWIQGPEIPASRRRGAAGLVLYNEKFYIVGGNTNGHDGGYVNWFDEYDPATGTWTTLPDAPRARDHFYASVIGDKMYALGGRLSGGPGGVFQPTIPEVDVFDFTSGNWTTLPVGSNIPTPRAGPITAVYNGKLLVMGGSVQNQQVYGTLTTDVLTLTELFDPVSGSWTRIEDANFKRRATQGIVSGNGVFTTGGSNLVGGGTIKNMEYYGEDNPSGTPLVSSDLNGPGLTQVPFGQNTEIALDVSNGNTGIIVTSMSLSGPDAALFSLDAGELTNSLIKANTTHLITIGYSGSATGDLATLTVNYGLSDQITIDLQSIEALGSGAVSSFTLINADTDTDLLTLSPGLEIDENTVSGINLAIRANTDPPTVGSVFLQLSGPVNSSRTENVPVYALFGNSGLDYFGQPFPAGTYTMTATAYDGVNLSGSDIGSLTIQFDIGAGGVSNNPPSVNNPGTQNNTEGDTVSLQISASDESTNLNYTAVGLPPDLSIDPGNGLITGTISSGGTAAGSPYTVDVTVTDDGIPNLETTVQFIWNVNEGTSNLPPVAIAEATPLNGDAPLEVTFTGSNSTDDIGIISYSWDFGDGGSSSLADPVYTYNGAGNFTATLTVTDGQGLQDITTVNINANDPGQNGVLSFTLINADTDQALYNLFEGLQIDENTISGTNLAIRANTNPEVVGSVFLQISGVVNSSRTENAAAYALFGNIGSDYFGQPFPMGSYTMTATAYSGSGLSGTDLGSLTVQFDVVSGTGGNLPPMAVASANVVSGTFPLQVSFMGSSSIDDVGVTSFSWDFGDGGSSNVADPDHTYQNAGTYLATLTVTDGDGLTDSATISIEVSAPVDEPPNAVVSSNITQGEAPLGVLFTGSNSTDDNGIISYSWVFGDGGTSSLADPAYTYTTPGNYTATLTVMDGSGQQDAASISINVQDPAAEGVVSFTLIDADSDLDLFEITDGMQFDFSVVQNITENIRANTNPSVVGSVSLSISGAVNLSRTEGLAPYALFGNIGPDYSPGTLAAGDYILTATPYSQANLQGVQGNSLSIQFSIVQAGKEGTSSGQLTTASGIELHPNPVTTSVRLVPYGKIKHIDQVEIYDTAGRLIKKVSGPVNQSAGGIMELSAVGLDPGLYHLLIRTDTMGISYKTIVVNK